MRDTIEDELATILANAMAAEIDWEIISGMMLDTGWVDARINTEQAEQAAEWCWTRYGKRYKNYRGHFLFKRDQDRVEFLLRWL